MNLRLISACVLFLAAAALSSDGEGKSRGIDFGFFLGGGYTIVDFEKASGYSDEYLEDWGQGHFKATLYGMLPLTLRSKAGIEIGYHDLYWWYYRIPYGPSPVYRSAEWSTVSVLAMFEKELGGIFYAQTGAGVHFFDGDPVMALSAAFGIKPHFKSLGFPVCFRVDPIFGAGFPITIALGAGVEFSSGLGK